LYKQFEGSVTKISLNCEGIFGSGFSVRKCLETAVKKGAFLYYRMFVF
jgi:hypothetical protein